MAQESTSRLFDALRKGVKQGLERSPVSPNRPVRQSKSWGFYGVWGGGVPPLNGAFYAPYATRKMIRFRGTFAVLTTMLAAVLAVA
ncbi:MAG: hypothetical protein ACFCBU_02675 [Cyanophyceae cyanobacterium]